MSRLAPPRITHWDKELAMMLDDARARPFRLGVWDCALFAAETVRVQTGFDGARDFRGRYTTRTGYLRALKRLGYGGIFDPFDAALGRRVPPALCGRGAIVSDGERVGVMWARGPLFVGGAIDDAAEIGLVSMPRASLAFGWIV